MSTVSISTVSMNAVSMSPSFAGQSTRKSHLRMTKRGRAVLTTLVAVPVIAVAVSWGLASGGATATDSSTPLGTVTVQPGETLWQVATAVAPNADPRDVVADIMSVNRLGSAVLQPGEKLEIPAKYGK